MQIISNLKQTPEKTNKLFADLQASEQFSKVLKKSKEDFRSKTPLERVSYEMELISETQEPVQSEILFAKYDENTVVSFERVTKGRTRRPVAVTGYFINGERLLQVEATNDQEIVITETNAPSDAFSFINLIPENNDVKVQDLFDGCLVFRDDYNKSHVYRHCGKACGDGSPIGGGTPINPLDSCCRAHDRCYSQFGFDDCGCDQELESCARNATTSPGWRSVYMWAGSKSCK